MELRKIAYPGRKLQLSEGSTISVYPFSILCADQVTGGTARMWGAVTDLFTAYILGKRKKEDESATAAVLCHRVFHVLSGDLLPILQASAPEVDLRSLAHWDMMNVISSWLLENFGEENKIAPFMAMAQKMFSNLKLKDAEGKESPALTWELEDWSNASSKAVTALKMFFIVRTTADSPTAAGPMQSVDTGNAYPKPAG